MKRGLPVIALCLAITILLTTAPIAASAQTGVMVQAKVNMNLRKGPGVQHPVLATVYAGTSLPADLRSADSYWVRVLSGAHYGWLSAGYLTITGNLASLPVGDENTPPGPVPDLPPPPPASGTIESLTWYASSRTADYYRLTYWSDGLRINGFYGEPKSPGQHAAVIYNRGGNRDTGKLTGVELAPLVESGFVVVASQFRGGGGSEGRDEFGGADTHDVLNLIPLLKSRAAVDPNRIVMMGGSRGGMMTYIALQWQTLQGTRDIKAAATISGLSDLISWGRERPDITGNFYPEIVGTTPAQNSAPFVARSAVYWAWRIRTPILLQHGDADPVVSVSQSRRLYSLIRYYGGTAKLITYLDGDHGLGNHLGGYPEAMKWFQTYVGRPGDNFDFYAHQDDISLAQIILTEQAE